MWGVRLFLEWSCWTSWFLCRAMLGQWRRWWNCFFAGIGTVGDIQRRECYGERQIKFKASANRRVNTLLHWCSWFDLELNLVFCPSEVEIMRKCWDENDKSNNMKVKKSDKVLLSLILTFDGGGSSFHRTVIKVTRGRYTMVHHIHFKEFSSLKHDLLSN